MVRGRALGERTFDIANHLFMLIFCFSTVYPFLYLLALSLEHPESSLLAVRLWPERFYLGSYEKVVRSDLIGYGFLNSLFRTVVGSGLSLVVSVCLAYPLAKRYLPNRTFWTGLIVFTMFFSGGLVPTYLLVKNLGFEAPVRPDGSFADFRTDLAVYRDGREVARKTIRVNDPLEVGGFVFHQNTFGAAETLEVRDPTGRLVWHAPVLMDGQILGKPQGVLSIPGSPYGVFVILDRDAAGAGRLTLVGTDGTLDTAGELALVFADRVALGGTSDPARTAGYAIRWTRAGAFTGIVAKRDPGQPLIWLAYLSLISGIVLTFYFPRRRVWARRVGDRLEVAMLADRHVDSRREFGQLLDDLARVTGRHPEQRSG